MSYMPESVLIPYRTEATLEPFLTTENGARALLTTVHHLVLEDTVSS